MLSSDWWNSKVKHDQDIRETFNFFKDGIIEASES